MTEFSFNIVGFEQGSLSTNGEPAENTKVVRSEMTEIPAGMQSLTAVPEIWRKKWNKESENYTTEKYEGSSASNTVYFYRENDDGTFEFLSYASAKNVDCLQLKRLGATHARFTASISSYTLYPDNMAETKSYYYYIVRINVSGTAVNWYYSNDRLTHEDMPDAPEKAMSKPYPKALWRIDDDIPYHELLPLEKPSGAFMNAVKLEYVRIPTSVQKIGRYAFTNTALRKVSIPSDCEYSETSFPENCLIEFYGESKKIAEYGQLYDSNGYVLIDADSARIYAKE